MKLYSRKMEPLANDSFEARIVRALEAQNDVRVPEEFAARVTNSLPARKPASKASHAGRTVIVVAAALVLVAMIWLAPQTTAHVSVRNLPFDVEMGLTVLLAAMALAMVKVWDQV